MTGDDMFAELRRSTPPDQPEQSAHRRVLPSDSLRISSTRLGYATIGLVAVSFIVPWYTAGVGVVDVDLGAGSPALLGVIAVLWCLACLSAMLLGRTPLWPLATVMLIALGSVLFINIALMLIVKSLVGWTVHIAHGGDETVVGVSLQAGAYLHLLAAAAAIAAAVKLSAERVRERNRSR